VLNLAGLDFQRQFRTRLSSTLSRLNKCFAEPAMKFSIITLLLGVVLCCIAFAVAREFLFPPTFRVHLVSPNHYQIGGIDVTKSDIELRLSKFSARYQHAVWPAKFEVVMPANMSGPGYDDEIHEMLEIGVNEGFPRVGFPRGNDDDPLNAG